MASTAVAAGDDAVGPRKGAGAGGGGTTTTPTSQSQQQPPPPPPPEQGLRCPRCDSPNTKFCYYNNYSLSQPRHFCKTCRRYWTKGGALRNVPVGGGCRKNKRSRSAAAAASSRLSLNLPVEGGIGGAAAADHQQQAAARLGFLGGGAPVVVSSPIAAGAAATAADFQGAAVGMMPLPRLHAPAVGQYVPFGEWPSGAGDIAGGGNGHPTNGGHAGAVSSSIASSIESLSFINQDLHWKLQQQRLATMFLGPPSSGATHADGAAAAHAGGAFLQMAAGPGMEAAVPAATSWFMDTSAYGLPSPPPPANTAALMGTTTSCNINGGRSSGDNDNAASSSNNNSNNNCSSAIPVWGDMSFAMLP
ncbi:hypothetical protein ACP70R_024918 [Stipagrostis hirtigluma subsp. patula]